MKPIQRRQSLSAEIPSARVQAIRSRIMAFHAETFAAAKSIRATGKKPAAKLRHLVK